MNTDKTQTPDERGLDRHEAIWVLRDIQAGEIVLDEAEEPTPWTEDRPAALN